MSTPVTTHENGDAAPSPVINPMIHLVGMGTLWEVSEHRMLWPHFEIYTDDQKAIVMVKNPFDDTEQEEVMYRDPAVIAAFRKVSEMLQIEWETPA